MADFSIPFGVIMAISINTLIGAYFISLYIWQIRDKTYLYWATSCFCFAVGATGLSVTYGDSLAVCVATLFDSLLMLAGFFLVAGLRYMKQAVCISLIRSPETLLLFTGWVILCFLRSHTSWGSPFTSAVMSIYFYSAFRLLPAHSDLFKVGGILFSVTLLLHATVMLFQSMLQIFQLNTSNPLSYRDLFVLTLLTHLLLTIATALFLPVLHLLRKQVRLQQLVDTDELTGVHSRRSFVEALTASRQAGPEPKSLLMIDIDHFKQVNDKYGHHVGDSVLVAVATCLAKTVRKSDVVGRIGGEEFAIMLPNMGLSDAYALAQRLRQNVDELIIRHESKLISVTVSIGVAETPSQYHSWEGLLSKADKALYKAKQQGRNLVQCHRQENAPMTYNPVQALVNH